MIYVNLNFKQRCNMCLQSCISLNFLSSKSASSSEEHFRGVGRVKQGGREVGRKGRRGRLQKFKRHPAAAAAVTPFTRAKRRIRILGRLCQRPNAVGQRFSIHNWSEISNQEKHRHRANITSHHSIL